MANLSTFKKQKNKFDALREKLKSKIQEKENNQTVTYDDSWKFRPKMVPGSVKSNYVVRFLPNMFVDDGQGEFWVEGFVHIFTRKDGKKIYTLCPKRHKKDKAPCPICEKAQGLYNLVNTGSASKDTELTAKMYYKKQRFFANVLVVSDPRTDDENQEGQVLVMEYGPQVQEKINDAILDQDINVHNPFFGHDFNLIIKNKADYVTYESSQFSMKSTPLSEDEDEISAIIDKAYDLNEKVFGAQRSYDDLKALLEGKPVSEASNAPKTTRDSDNGGEKEVDGNEENSLSDSELEDTEDTSKDTSSSDVEEIDDDELDLDDDELFE